MSYAEMQIKRCPFCGDRASLTEYTYDPDNPECPVLFRVVCDNDDVTMTSCCTMGPCASTREAAITAWNQRLELPQS